MSTLLTGVNTVFAAQSDHTIFQPLLSYSGEYPSGVQSIFQSESGYMWIGTDNGIYRFDGYDFENASFDENK